ncbi:putative beta-lactamase-like 1 isoform X3 [Lethenteron reissneri]|uniref:putative beta-lactamase-like 1 isoform X3 n=1 Tax=Lethenteron reissneri TaxID=7753 RepID=UPI002AB7B79B|nr:putative beta-lactamase-like 1 isoform X3 [Lethenteron reissneri]
MLSSVADLAKLSTPLLGTSQNPVLTRDTVKVRDVIYGRLLGRQLGYTILRKDGDIDGYAATFSIVPQLELVFVLLIAGRPHSGCVCPAAADLRPRAA